MARNAYVTFLAGKGDYVMGVVGLAKSLRKHNNVYPLVVAVLSDVPEEHRQLMLDQGCILRDILPVDPPPTVTTTFSRAYFALIYSKFPIWEFVEYERIVFLDADMQIFDNIDNLFDLPKGYLYAVVSCFCEPGWKETPQYKIGYCQQFADKMEWPAHLGLYHPNYFNAGLFVFEPSVSTYRDMLKTLAVTPSTAFAEQDFMNLYFKDKFKPLPVEYNLMIQFLWRHPTKVDLNKAKVVHFSVAGFKPWRHESLENLDRDDLKKLVKLWWDVYNDASLDYNPKSSKIFV